MELAGQLLAIVLVSAALAATVILGRRQGWIRMQGRAAGRPASLEVIERLALTPNHSLHLVRVDQQTLLVAVSPGTCTLLEKLDAEPYRALRTGAAHSPLSR